ncbi:MAG: hypothetical protein ACRDTG_08880 [Pseudonocardiaceae bacterium]
MIVHDASLREREWTGVLEPLFSSERPNRHVVLDDALNPAAFTGLRSELLSSQAWHYRSQPGYVLCLTPSESLVISDVAHRLGEIFGRFQPGLEACERWAFLHQQPFEEFVHSDIGAYVWTLWLTPEKWDRSPHTSGLRLYPLVRPEGMPNTRQHTLKYFQANPVADSAYVHYRENRAVVFPASTFHSIGPCHFEASTVDSMRCSVSIFFDSREHWQALHKIENVTAETANHGF